jgi:DNA-binding beta-propeller fold protein YncE
LLYNEEHMILVGSGYIARNRFLFLISAFFLICLVVPHSAHAAFTFNSQISGGIKFQTPNDIVLDSSGNVYVVDQSAAVVEEFTSSGVFIRSFDGTNGGTQFSFPVGAAVNSSGDVYVADGNFGTVQEFDPTGAFIRSFDGTNGGTQFSFPQGLAIVPSSGNIYVADANLGTVQEFTSSGVFIRSFDGTNGGGTQFVSPSRLVLDSSGDIYVADSGTNLIQEFTSVGVFIQSFDGTNGGIAFSRPQGVSIDSSDNVYVADTNNNLIQEFTSVGVFIQSFDGTNGGTQFSSPYAVAVSPSGGSIYVIDNNPAVQKFTSSGVFVTRWTGQGIYQANGVALDSSGNIYVINQGDNTLSKFNSSGNLLSHWTNLVAGGNLDGIAVDSSNNVVYIADQGNGIIEKFSTSGTFITSFDGTAGGGTQFSCPTSVAVDSSGKVYVVDNCGTAVQEFDSSGTFITSFDGTNGGTAFACPEAVAVDPSGNIYVSDNCAGTIQKFTSSGAFVTGWGNTNEFSNVSALSFDASSGDLYASDQGNETLFIFDSNGNLLAQTGGPAGHTFGNITDAVSDPSGVIYISDSDYGFIAKLGQTLSVPTVSSLEPSSVTLTSAALNGFISDMGGFSITTRGFSYGTTLSYGATTSASGALFGGPFSLPLSNLSAGTTYHIRAFATNSQGTAYGSDIAFPPYYEFQVAGPGSASGLYSQPQGMTFDPSNNLYIADSLNNRIEKFDSSSGFVTTWGVLGSGNGNLNEPFDVAVNPSSGNVYVADYGNNRIEEFDSSGNYITKWGSSGSLNGQFRQPVGIVINPSSGNVYVADLANKRVQEFNSSGTFITSFDGSNGGTQFSVGPISMALDSSHNLYVIDGYNASLIQEFTPSGVFVRSIAGSGATAFLDPRSVTVDSSNNIYISDTGNSRMEKFDSSGTFVNQWANNFTPYVIAADSSGAVYVLAQNTFIDKFIFNPSAPAVITSAVSPVTYPVATLNGSIVGTGGVAPTVRGFVYGLTTAYGATTTESGSFATSTFSANVSGLTIGKVYHVRAYATNSSGTTYGIDKAFIIYSQASFGGPGTGNGQFGITGNNGPQGMAFDSSGNIYIADADNNRIEKFDSSGNYESQFDGSNGGTTFNSPRGLAIDSLGHIYVADSGNGIVQEFTPSGVFISSFNGGSGGGTTFSSPTGIAIDPFGNIYVVDGRTSLLEKFNSSGAFITNWSISSFGWDGGTIAFDSSGNVYATYNNYFVEKFDPSGTLLAHWGGNGNGNGLFGYASSVAIDSSGNIYIVDGGNGLIEMFDSNRNFLTQLQVSGSDPNPTDLAIDPSGNIYLSAFNNTSPLIWKFTLTASSPTLTTSAASSIAATSATLNGSITAAGGVDATQSGFAYGTDSTLESVIATTTLGTETGTASFSSSVSSLTCNVPYYFRSYATNLGGTGYGSILSFTTSSCSSASNSSPAPIIRKYGGGGSTSVKPPVVSTPPITQTAPLQFSFTKNLSFGLTNPDVKNLQKFLNSHGFIVSKTGSGSLGSETDYFGPATRAALAAFQKANNIVPAVGYFGPITRGVAGKLLLSEHH